MTTINDPILVTGSAGFIGFHVAKALLEEGRTVVGIDNLNNYYDPSLKQARLQRLEKFENFSFKKIDISCKDEMENLWKEKGPFRKVIHLAAQAGVRYSLVNPYEYITSNCMGHLTVLEMCRYTEGFEHLVYASSSSVYGKNHKLPYAVEDEVNHPVSLYAATKRSDELMSEAYANLYSLPQTGLRFFTVYGPWGRPDMAPFIFTKSIIDGIKLKVFNHGQMRRDFTYIDDIVSGVIASLAAVPEKEKSHRILNLGNKKSENLLDFIQVVEEAVGKKAEMEMQKMQQGDVRETFADITETTRITGFQPTTSIDVGIPKFVEWYKDYYKT